jgi:hypothetical protein
MAAPAAAAGESQLLPSQLFGVGLGLKRLPDGTLVVNKSSHPCIPSETSAARS